MFGADAATFLADFGSQVTWVPSSGAPQISALMVFDQASEVLDDKPGIISRQYSVTFETAAWPGLKRNEQLVIGDEGGGATYRLRTDIRAQDDGVFSMVELTKV